MPDEIKQRLEDSTEKCVKAYEAWRKDEKNVNARESLQEAVHEVRKVASRLEIELVKSDRDSVKQKPMPAPSHRNSKGPQTAKKSPEGNKDGNKNEETAKSLEKLKKKPEAEKEGAKEE